MALVFDTSSIPFSHKDRKRKVRLPASLTPLLAEDIGATIGDGSINLYKAKTGIDAHYSCCGDPIEDKEWYLNFLIPAKKELFNLELKGRNDSDGTFKVRFRSKAILAFYHALGLEYGRKTNVRIPKIIMEASDDVRAACLRGLIDTDGSLTSKKKKRGEKNEYPTISLRTTSKNLADDIIELLNALKIHCSICEYTQPDSRSGHASHGYLISVCGEKNLEKWMEKIGFSNPKHETKYRVYKKFWFCQPRSTLAERNKILKINSGPDAI